MPQPQVNELAQALETFNNVSLPTLAFFFAVILLLVMGILIRGLFGRDQRRDDLMGMAMKSSTSNGEAITDLKRDIADALKGMRDDGSKSNERHIEVIQALTTNVGTHADKIGALLTSSQQEVETLKEVAEKVSTLYDRFVLVFPTENSMDAQFAAFKDEMRQLVTDVQTAYAQRKHDSRPIPTVTINDITSALPNTEASKPEDVSALTPGADEGKKAS